MFDLVIVALITLLFIALSIILILTITSGNKNPLSAYELTTAPNPQGGFPALTKGKRFFSRRVSYESAKCGKRTGKFVGFDKSGRVRIHLDDHPKGVFVRRQRHLVSNA